MTKTTSQPEPQQRYQDASGAMVIVHSVQFNRVMFYRVGVSPIGWLGPIGLVAPILTG